ncbi:MAG: DUF454 domain-containing protein [Gammaproteobacteria bacterium]|nr:DUF454 domain-containing protein [Gammaproteobacteria bacterium]
MIKKILFITLGSFSLLLGLLGLVLPILPTTPFVLLAAFCFARSSDRLYQKLTRNRIFGPIILHWQQHRTIPRKAKILGMISIVFAGIVSLFFSPFGLVGKSLLVFLLFIPVLILIRIPSTKEAMVSQVSVKNT